MSREATVKGKSKVGTWWVSCLQQLLCSQLKTKPWGSEMRKQNKPLPSFTHSKNWQQDFSSVVTASKEGVNILIWEIWHWWWTNSFAGIVVYLLFLPIWMWILVLPWGSPGMFTWWCMPGALLGLKRTTLELLGLFFFLSYFPV